MNMSLQELYQDLRERQPLLPDALKPGRRIGVIYPDSVHIITIAATGPGRVENDYVGQQLIAVARISTGQPALRWEPDGTVHLMKLQEVANCLGYRELMASGDYLNLDLPGCSSEELLQPKLGVLSHYYGKAVWEPVGNLPSVPVTKQEKRAVWTQTPLEMLVDDNCPKGEINSRNRWFYEHAAGSSRKNL